VCLHRNFRAAALAITGLLSVTPALAEPTISGRVVDPDGKGISQAIVFVDTPAAAPSTSQPTAIMDQINKTFVPGVLPVVVGTEVRFPNRDQISHHVYSFSRTKSFELPLYKGEDAPPVLFDKPGVVKIGCNIHDWMSAIILVLPNAHFAKTDADGRFTLPGLKPGAYSLVAWHPQSREKVADTAQRVQLAASDIELTFHLSLVDERSRPAMRGSRWDQ
jgi:plastocyanin